MDVLSLVDRSRPTGAVPGGSKAADARTLRTLVCSPTDGGPLPLVLYAHGLDCTFEPHTAVIESIAGAGYVVVAPSFPETSTAGIGAFGFYEAQPTDLHFVTDQVVSLGREQGSVLAGRIDDSRIGAVGHSLGGATVYAATYHSRLRDPRIGAAAVICGLRLPFEGGELRLQGAPLLLIHGGADELLGIEHALEPFDEAGMDRWLVTLPDATHTSWRDEAGPEQDITTESLVAFFDHVLKHDDRAADHLEQVVASSGVATCERRRAETTGDRAAGRGSTPG